MGFFAYLVASLIAGLGFAALAVWLTTTKGNTMAEILRSQHLKDAEVLRTEILGQLKISTNLPIVALYLVAATVAVGLPAYIWTKLHKDVLPVYITGTVVRPTASSSKVYFRPHDSGVDDAGSFELPLLFDERRSRTLVSLEGPDYAPITLTISVDADAEKLTVGYSDRDAEDRIEIRKSNATLPIIHLRSSAPLDPASVPNVPSTAERPTFRPAAPPEARP